MLVIGYVRVSSTEQEGGYGPEVQEEAIRTFCGRKGLDEPEIISESVSAESLVARAEIKDIISRARKEQEDGTQVHIVFHKLDRLARDLTDQETVVGLAMRSGFRLYSTISAEEDTLNPAYMGDPARVLIRQVFGMFNQFERATIQARLDSGLALKAKAGGSTGGRMPFGYMTVNRDIAINPATAPAVVRAFELQACRLDRSSMLALLAKEFPEHCGHWGRTQLSLVLKRIDLYCNGLYQTRLGVAKKHRPELVIVKDRFQRPRQQHDQPVGEIRWESVPDPVNMLTLTLLTGMTKDRLQAGAHQHGIAVKWVKGRMLFARADAQALVSKLGG